MIPNSVLGGRQIYSNLFKANGTADITASTYKNEYTLIVENPAGMNEQHVSNNGGSLEFTVSSANSVGAYGDYATVHLVRIPQLANVEFLARMAVPSSSIEQYYFVCLRSDSGADQGAALNCYAFQHVSPTAGGDANIQKNIAGTLTYLTQDNQSLSTGDCWIRGFIRGDQIGVRTWQGTAEEPHRFETITDADLPGRGYVDLGLTGGNSGTDTFTCDWMELHVWDLDAPPPGAIARLM
jgi:hypothetical protein